MHRAESILQAITTTLTGLTTTQTRVERARVWPVNECPAISIERGDDQTLEEGRSLGFQDRQLEVVITSYVKASSTSNPETELNQIAAEVYTALFADVTQGLSYVIDTHWFSDSRPEMTGQESKTAVMRMTFIIHYRHSLTSPEN